MEVIRVREYQCWLEYNGRTTNNQLVFTMRASNIQEVIKGLTKQERMKLIEMTKIINTNSIRAFFLKKTGLFKTEDRVYLIEEVE
jgi:hypothetical protein